LFFFFFLQSKKSNENHKAKSGGNEYKRIRTALQCPSKGTCALDSNKKKMRSWYVCVCDGEDEGTEERGTGANKRVQMSSGSSKNKVQIEDDRYCTQAVVQQTGRKNEFVEITQRQLITKSCLFCSSALGRSNLGLLGCFFGSFGLGGGCFRLLLFFLLTAFGWLASRQDILDLLQWLTLDEGGDFGTTKV